MSTEIENKDKSSNGAKPLVSSSNSTLYSKCCREEPNNKKKDNIEYYECPYCKQECEVEWMEDEFPDYCH